MLQGKASASCGKAQQCSKSHVLFGPWPSLVFGSLLNEVIPGAGKYGHVTHGGGTAVLGGHNDIVPPQALCESRMALAPSLLL